MSLKIFSVINKETMALDILVKAETRGQVQKYLVSSMVIEPADAVEVADMMVSGDLKLEDARAVKTVPGKMFSVKLRQEGGAPRLIKAETRGQVSKHLVSSVDIAAMDAVAVLDAMVAGKARVHDATAETESTGEASDETGADNTGTPAGDDAGQNQGGDVQMGGLPVGAENGSKETPTAESSAGTPEEQQPG